MKKLRITGVLGLGLFLLFSCAKGAKAPELCGNAAIDPLEGCDDGARVDGDGCDADCAVEPGYICTGAPSTCLESCGNGTLDAGEDCDGPGETATCNVDCTTSRCGDGIHNATAGEACDDGGQTELCNPNCTLVGCGDGVTNTSTGEQCDGGGETASCNTNCTWSSCGDGITNGTAGEDCDDAGETASCNADCTVSSCGDGTANATAGEGCDDAGESASCNADCTVSSCGDGTTNATAGEDCDGGGETASCNADCTVSSCGDGTTNATAGEACDDAGESAACNANCTISECGDGIHNVTAGEQCDDGDDIDGNDCSNACTNNIVCLDPLTTPLAGGNGWAGSMFDVVAQRNVTITGFAGSFYAGAQTVEIWYRTGTYVGNTSGMTGWTQLGTTSITGQGNGVATPIPINLSVQVNAGQRVAFWVTCQGTYGSGNIYTSGPTAGTLLASNADLQIYSGVGTYYPLSSGIFADRSFNGIVQYDCR
ncbi:hypothetical protein KKC22_20280 [Myxococcota bacterium]|nr:hypothetical protein [Myxococcota bacterium]